MRASGVTIYHETIDKMGLAYGRWPWFGGASTIKISIGAGGQTIQRLLGQVLHAKAKVGKSPGTVLRKVKVQLANSAHVSVLR